MHPVTGVNGQPTASPVVCTPGWSSWINKNTPTAAVDSVEHEFMSVGEQRMFCPGGNIKAIECATVDDIPAESSGEILTCYKDTGLTCNNVDNQPIPCSDYHVRYECQCAGNTFIYCVTTIAFCYEK